MELVEKSAEYWGASFGVGVTKLAAAAKVSRNKGSSTTDDEVDE